MARIIFCLFTIIIYTQEVYSASFDISENLMSIRKIAREFRQPVINKLLQLKQNFIEKKYSNGFKYLSNEDVVCPMGQTVKPFGTIVDYHYNFKSETKNGKVYSFENRFIEGCSQNNSLIESFVSVGDRAFPSSLKDLAEGDYNFSMPEQKEELDYKLVDSQGIQVLRLHSKKINNEMISTWYLGDEKYLVMNFIRQNNFTEIRYQYYPILFSINRNGFDYSMRVAGSFEGIYKVHVHDNGELQYFNNHNQQIALASFQQKFAIQGANFIMDSILIELPATQFVSAGNQSARLMEELRNAQIWLINGNQAQINLVKNLINEYIQDVENGLIVDKRPKRQ